MAKIETLNVTVFRAQPLGGKQTPKLNLKTGNPFPPFSGHEDARVHFLLDAAEIVNGLEASLPGGTVDQVLIKLLSRKASELRVASPKPL